MEWNPGLDPGPEKKTFQDNWKNSNKVYRLVSSFISVLIYWLQAVLLWLCKMLTLGKVG